MSDVFDVGINGGTVTLDNTSTPSNITINSLSIASGSILDTESGATLTLVGVNNLTNAGALFVGVSGSTNGTTLNVGGSLTNSGTLDVGGNTTNGAVEVAGSFDNTTGVLHIQGGNTAGVPSEVNVSTAAPSTFEGPTQLIGLTGGAILNYGSGAITQIGGGGSGKSGEITLYGANAAVEIAGASGNSALTTLANIAANGALAVAGGAVVTTNSGVNLTNAGIINVGIGSNINGSTLNVGGSLTNSSTLEVGGFGSNGNGLVNAMSVTNSDFVEITSTGTVNVSTTYTQTGGTTDVDGTLMSPTVSVSGGTLSGTGVLQGNVTFGSGGTLLPGEPGTPGTLAVNGNLSFAGGTLDETINSGADNGFSVLNVSGTLDLTGGANLDILLASDFAPVAGEQFLFATAGSLDGQFTITDPLFDNGQFQWVLSATGDAVDIFLTVQPVTPSTTPEPASLLLFGTGLLGLAWIMRRRMKAST